MFEQIVFYLFATLLLFFSLLVITVRNSVYAALSLVMVFFSSAAIWLLLTAEFLAVALVLVYVGAVMVLFLFVVMLLDVDIARLKEGFTRFLPLGVVVVTLMAMMMIAMTGSEFFDSQLYSNEVYLGEGYSNTALLGHTLYNEYLYEFEIAGVILLVAIVAAIVLTISQSKNVKTPNPDNQVQVNKATRLKIMKVKSEQD